MRPGQNGAKKLVERYGERVVGVRYLYDEQNRRRHTSVELIIESWEWTPRGRSPRRRDEDAVMVRISWREADLRERAKRLGAIWRPAQKFWEITWSDAKRLEIAERVVGGASMRSGEFP